MGLYTLIVEQATTEDYSYGLTLHAESGERTDLSLGYDRRWRSWAKIVRAADIDLSKPQGHALGGRWVRIGESVVLGADEWLVVASEHGSAKFRRYGYRTIDGTGHVIQPAEIASVLANVTSEERAKAANSELYEIAAYIHASARQDDPRAALIEERGALLRRLREIDALLGSTAAH